MSKDTIERAIKRGAGGDDGANYEEVRYEGYGPGGVAIIVEALTDNRNRTASDLRIAFSKHGGALGETNSVSFMFERKGMVRYPAKAASADAMFEAALEAGAENVESDAEGHEVDQRAGGFRPAARRARGQVRRRRRKRKLVWRPHDGDPGGCRDRGNPAEAARCAGRQRRRADRRRPISRWPTTCWPG